MPWSSAEDLVLCAMVDGALKMGQVADGERIDSQAWLIDRLPAPH